MAQGWLRRTLCLCIRDELNLCGVTAAHDEALRNASRQHICVCVALLLQNIMARNRSMDARALRNNKALAGASGAVLFTAAAIYSRSLVPLVVVTNAVCHHRLFPLSSIAYWADIGFNSVNILRYSITSTLTRWYSFFTISGYAIGQIYGGCTTKTGVWAHILLCQAPGAVGSVVALRGDKEMHTLSTLEWCVVCGWAWAVVERLLLPCAIHDRARVAWAFVCSAIGLVSAVVGLRGYMGDGRDNAARIAFLMSLRTAHEVGSFIVEVGQRKATNVVFCAHHVLFLLLSRLHRPDWHDAHAQAYLLPDGRVLCTEKEVLYLIGCTEISSVFLQAITAAADKGWNREGTIARRSLLWSKPVFALVYVIVRVFWWPVHVWPLIYRAVCLSATKEQEHRVCLQAVAWCLSGLSTMQLRWGYTIAHMAAAQ